MFGAVEVRWRRLRLPLAACAAAALVGGAATAAAWWRESRIAERADAAETRLEAARGRYSALAEEERTRRRYAPLYRRLAAEGLIGEEQPARRAEAVRSAAAAVFAARHRTGARRVVQRRGPVEVRATGTSIDLDLRHEAELPVFLAALDREAPGLFTVAGCRLLRADETSPPLAAIAASCRIRWQSVALSGVEPGWMPAAGNEVGDGAEDGPGPGHGPEGWRPRLADPPRAALGRLFTTAAERAEIESAAASRTTARETAEVPEEAPPLPEPPPRTTRWVRVGGVVARSGRSVYAWIDDRRVAFDGSRAAPTEAPAPAETAARAGAETLGVRLDAGRRSILVRPGQRFDPRTGAVTDPIHTPQGRSERARSLHESSRAPLTVPPAREQN